MQKELETRLALYLDPYLKKDWGHLRVLKNLQVTPNEVILQIALPYPHEGLKASLKESLKHYLETMLLGKELVLECSLNIEPHVGKVGMRALPSVKNMIAVASGKGGVGKSTVALNLALALAQEGAAVGLLDADIYGPSQPTMLGVKGEKPIIHERTITPILRHGIKSMSIGYLVEEEVAMMWRGPMLGKALEQIMYDTKWGELDYLIVDMPPGTGDVQLTLCQKMPVSGALMVTTPQEVSLIDVRRACEMFKVLQIPLLGVIENMSGYQCRHCGHHESIFGEGAANQLMQQYDLNLLAAIPLESEVRAMADEGKSLFLEAPHRKSSEAFLNAARQMAFALALQKKDYSSKFPKIVVEQDKKTEERE